MNKNYENTNKYEISKIKMSLQINVLCETYLQINSL